MQTDIHAGQMIKFGAQTTELLQDALQMPADSQAYQLAVGLSEQLDTALTELGLDASELYQMSRADQIQLIDQVTDKVLNDQTIGELARLVNSKPNHVASNMSDAANIVSKTTVDDSAKNGTIKPDRIVEGHASTPRDAAPGSVIDRVDASGNTNTRTFYGKNGRKEIEIHTGNHGNCKTHKFGVNGEHAHDYVWDADGRLKSKEPRELTDNERKSNGDIL